MIVTTTPTIEGRRIVEYKGIVFGEVISGVNFVKDIAASFSNFFGGRSGSYEEELIAARQNALAEMEQRALQVGANAVVVGVDIDYEVLGADNGMLMVTASATWIDLAVGLKWSYDVKKVAIPYFFVAGTGQADSETISPLSAMNEAFDEISGQLTVMARRKNTDHGEMLVNADGYMTAWFCYTLKDDAEASKVFTGEDPEIEITLER